MKKVTQTFLIILTALIVYACDSSEAANDKLAELKSLKEEQKELGEKIDALEEELRKSGVLEEKKVNKVLVSTITVAPQSFQHKIEVRGSVESRKDVVLSAESMGRIISIPVSEGQHISKGQLLLQQDAEIIRNNIQEVNTQLELATTVYERQSKLWEQNIGTEVQYLQAKNNKESLESRLSTLRSQLRQASVYAPFNGVIDNISTRVGEMAQPGMPLLRVVSPREMYVTADVSESYLGNFSDGQEVEIYFPSQDKTVISKIISVGQVIKSENRTFEVEVSLPRTDFPVKPNQVVRLELVDYRDKDALILPTKIIQNDSKGNYVFEIVEKDGDQVANKVYVKPGLTYSLMTEILEGVSVDQIIAYEGYRELTQDVVVTTK